MRIAIGALAVIVTAIASFFSISSANTGETARSSLTLIAPAAAGGGWDTFQREQQHAMRANSLVNNIQVVNIPGAGGTIGMGKLSTMGDQAALMVGGTGQIAAQTQFNTAARIEHVTPIARVVEEYSLITVPADAPWTTFGELVDDWRSNPASIVWTGGGSFDQLVMTDIALKAGIPVAETTYPPADGGGEAIQALLNGSAQVTAGGFADMYPQIEAGRMRTLGVVAPERLNGHNIPTLVEQGFNVTLSNWRALFGPPGLSGEQAQELATIIQETVATPEWHEAVARNQWQAVPLYGPELKAYVEEETTRIEQLFEEMNR